MSLVVFLFAGSGEEAFRGEVCADATVGTFNEMLKDKVFSLPPGGLYYLSGEQFFHSSATASKVGNGPTVLVKWSMALKGSRDGHKRRCSLVDVATCVASRSGFAVRLM